MIHTAGWVSARWRSKSISSSGLHPMVSDIREASTGWWLSFYNYYKKVSTQLQLQEALYKDGLTV